ncbi:MAG: D-alanyl-D-alanine carboxypeptidase/D-alanyl-D-alanine-endopeptidase [Sphingomicrobium sp.]
MTPVTFRRFGLAVVGGLISVSLPLQSGFAAGPVPTIPAEARKVIDEARYRNARWGLHVADLKTGEVLFEWNADQRFLGASTTKLFAGAAALDAYGADHRFTTPVYRTGPVDSAGTLSGNLVIVASADPTMGGRTTAKGTIDFTSIDHINAVALPLATLTPEDPLAGLDDLARQVAASGIRKVEGDVLVDARLFAPMEKDGYILSPVWINDNLIDFTITPGAAGTKAKVVSRPLTARFTVEADVDTAAGAPLTVAVTSSELGIISVSGNIPANQGPLVQVYQVPDPPAFARTLLIEALKRHGVAVAANPLGPNPAGALPAKGSYRPDAEVAKLVSPPFSENIKLIFKTSHNQHADLLIFLLALKRGEVTFDDGMSAIHDFLKRRGLDPLQVSLSDGRGNEFTDLFSPRTIAGLLRNEAKSRDYKTYFDALPVLGVDGTERDTVPASSRIAGKAFLKSGTTVSGDDMNQRAIIMTRGLAGYMKGKSGRELVVALYVNDVPLDGDMVPQMMQVIQDQGVILEYVYDRT